MRAATVVQVLRVLFYVVLHAATCCSCNNFSFKFYCMFYCSCDGSLTWSIVLSCRLPQLLYPSTAATPTATFLPATAGTPTALTALPQPAPHSPITAQTLAAIGHPLIEYSTLAFAAAPHLQAAAAAGFDAYPTPAAAAQTAGLLAHTAAGPSASFTPIAYAAPGTPVTAAGVQLGHQLTAATHYRPLSIQDRM